MALRHGAVPLLFIIGVFNQPTRPCPALNMGLGPFSTGAAWSAGADSDGVSQYEPAVAAGRSATAFGTCRSGTAPPTDSLISAPTCSWDALMDLRIFRANQIPVLRKTTSTERFPSSYQLLCIHAVNSFMASPWTGTASSYNRALSQETGRRSSKWSGRYLPPRPIGPVAARACQRSVGTHEHPCVAAAVARPNNPIL